jgi:hypothetical protein
VRAFWLLLGTTCALVQAQSHPSWWTWVSPEATALVGIRWEILRTSSLGTAIESKLFGKNGFTTLDLECLKQTRQILLSDPPFLAVASGQFPAATVASQAAKRGLRRSVFKNVELWISPGKDVMSLARLSGQLVLIGDKEVLQAAIERSQADGPREYSHLLPRAAIMGQQNLWLVQTGAPIPLTEEFAAFEQDANDPAKLFLPAAPPPQPKPPPPPSPVVSVNGVPTPAPPPTPAAAASPAAPSPVARAAAVPAAGIEPAPPKPATPPAAAVKPASPPRKTIRIVGLDEGTREVDLPPAR